MMYNKTYSNSKVWPIAYTKQPIIWGFEQFEDTKVITRSFKSRKDRQPNGQKEGQTTQWPKGTINDIQITTQKAKD